MDTLLDTCIRLYVRWLQYLCLLAVLWYALPPSGVVLTLTARPTWMLQIGGSTLGLYTGMGQGIMLPVSIWPLIGGVVVTVHVVDRMRRRVARDG